MQQLKESTNWRIAAIYYIIGGLFIPRTINFIVTLIAIQIDTILFIPTYFFLILDFITITLAIWLSTYYSAKYINKKYIIKNKSNIVKNALIIFILIQLGGLGGVLTGPQSGWFGLLLLESIFIVSLFYFLSDRYIKNTEINSSIIEPSQPTPPTN